jgi:hypothetical protein
MKWLDTLLGKGSLRDREFATFEEVETDKIARRVTDHTLSEVYNEDDNCLTVCDISPNEKGETLAAGETISAVKAVYSNGTNLFLGDADEDYQHASVIGISLTSGNVGTEIRYIIDGQLYDSSFAFTDGEPVYLGISGALTQVDPDSSGHKYRVLIGYATGTNGINININEPIEL